MTTGAATGSILITGIGELVTNDPERDGLLGIVRDGAVAVVEGTVAHVGPAGAVPASLGRLPTLDVSGRAVLPGFVDAHTHLVFAGDRAGEFAMRMAGASYEAIMEAGGGIRSTVRATRAATVDELVDTALARLERMVEAGTTTVEVKTGYGLDVRSERAMVDAIVELDRRSPAAVIPTFLGAHVVGPEFEGDRAGYLELVTGPMLDAVAGDVAFVDVFCDRAAFTVDESHAIADAAAARGLRLRIHADQLSHSGGSALAAAVGAVSADHIDHASDEDLAALAAAGTVAVLLPGVSYAMREPPPDGRRVWDAGVTVALATDCNPGTAWIETMPFVISLGVLSSGLSPEEAVWAATRGGALALALPDRGILTPGSRGDLVVLDAPNHVHLAYRPDGRIVDTTIVGGSVAATAGVRHR